MRIFITGATGYIGGALARRLVADGHQVIALVRPGSDGSALAAGGVEIAEGDITDRYSMRVGMAGADWVVHAAATVQIDGPLPPMTAVNVDGSENVASLAFKLGVGRLLALSSVAAFGGSPPDGRLVAEDAPVQRPLPSPYSVTKRAGEERIRAWAKQGLRLNVVYPGLVYGPPGKKSGANYLLRAILKGRFPALVGADRKSSWVYLDDVVEALVRIIERTEPGRDYLLAGDVAVLRDLVGEVCRLGGGKPPRLSLPLAPARFLLNLTAPLFRLAGKRPPIPPGQLESLGRHWAFDDSRAREELGWQPRPLSEGLPPTVDWLRAAG